MTAAARFRTLMAQPGVIQAGGVGDAAQALLVQSVGYPAVYMSGAYVNYTYGVPDGSLTLSEIVERLRQICSRVDVPVIADADDGFGGIVQVFRTVRDFERAGAAALHIEDMVVKKHGHPLPLQEALVRLRAALDARANTDFAIIARTDAMAPWREGVEQNRQACEEEAFERCVAYAEAGADLVMPLYPNIEWLKNYGKRIPKPILPLFGVNASHRAPQGDTSGAVAASQCTAADLASYNVKLVVYPTNMISRALAFMRREYSQWLEAGQCIATEEDQKNRWEANVLVGVPEKYKLLEKYGHN